MPTSADASRSITLHTTIYALLRLSTVPVSFGCLLFFHITLCCCRRVLRVAWIYLPTYEYSVLFAHIGSGHLEETVVSEKYGSTFVQDLFTLHLALSAPRVSFQSIYLVLYCFP